MYIHLYIKQLNCKRFARGRTIALKVNWVAFICGSYYIRILDIQLYIYKIIIIIDYLALNGLFIQQNMIL